jgi:hypothetical protein
MQERKDVISLSDYKRKQAARGGFREWRRLFQTLPDLDERTRWSDLPDWVILYLSEDSHESRLTLYDLIMGTLGLGSGYQFETLPPEVLLRLMDSYFAILDRLRFECMHRLGWIEEPVPGGETPIIEQILQERNASPPLVSTPRMTSRHPGYGYVSGEGDFDYGRFLRMHIPDAVREFRKRISAHAKSGGNAHLRKPE